MEMRQIIVFLDIEVDDRQGGTAVEGLEVEYLPLMIRALSMVLVRM